jgi:integrase
LAAVKDKTFRECAEAYIAAHETTWRHPKHHHQWNASLKQYVYPLIGDLSVAAIDVGLVLQVLEPIWKRRTETASRVRGRIEAILDWARVHKLREGENPARWRGHLKHLLPEKSKLRKVIHHPALPYTEINGFMTHLRQQDGIVARALEFTILTAARKSEVTGARWSEIDGNVWTIPGERMKGGRKHRVPLCDRAVAILKSLPHESDFVFIGAQNGRPIGDAVMPDLMERMGRDDITVHGFRSTFKDWASETTAYPNHVVEQALAHAIGNGVEAAYRRGDLFEKRRQLMESWAQYCSGPHVEADVVPLRA